MGCPGTNHRSDGQDSGGDARPDQPTRAHRGLQRALPKAAPAWSGNHAANSGPLVNDDARPSDGQGHFRIRPTPPRRPIGCCVLPPGWERCVALTGTYGRFRRSGGVDTEDEHVFV